MKVEVGKKAENTLSHAIFLKRIFLLLFITFCHSLKVFSQNAQLDVQRYEVTIEPDIPEKSVKGVVTVHYSLPIDENSLTLDAGNLQIKAVSGPYVNGFSKDGQQLSIQLSENRDIEDQVTIEYYGKPKKGVYYKVEKGQVYTAYFTSSWIICNDRPSDKATIDLKVLVPYQKDCIANGELQSKVADDDKVMYHWKQQYETPSYSYGFVIGDFQQTEMKIGELTIRNYATDHSLTELNHIFSETPAMIDFFEDKTGIRYGQKSYSQVLIGDHYQEMAGYSVLMNGYGNLVLKDSTETNLISHELAHQWWGNRITCESWNHFWLNEAFATFMSAAYNEHRFGIEKYMADINAYRSVYENIKRRGKDKPMVFDNWNNPSRNDRNIVYFKGAYVLYLLRKELGDEAFWAGIKSYSQRYFDKTVTTQDFQQAMETAANRPLDEFFDEWVYQ